MKQYIPADLPRQFLCVGYIKGGKTTTYYNVNPRKQHTRPDTTSVDKTGS